MTTRSHIPVGIVVARRALKGPWADHAWLPVAALPAVPAAAPWTPLGREGDDELFFGGACDVALHRSATAHYRDNLASGRPSLWVAIRPGPGGEPELSAATADPYEGEALAEGIGEIIEAVPMPETVREELAAFVEAYHVERPFLKRRRDRADPEALGRRGRSRREEDTE